MLLLIFRKFINVYIEKHIINIILIVLKKYNIRNNLNYFVINNVENNNTMLIVIAKNLRKINNINFDFI